VGATRKERKTITGLMAHHFPILITTIKLKEIKFTQPPVFLIPINAIILFSN
jgi:hypothetical protein